MDIDLSASTTESPLAAATGKRARRQMPESTRRVLLIVLGALAIAASVVGFYVTSDAFDKRTPVLVSAVDIQRGDTVSAGYFTSELAVMGSIPHIRFTLDAPFAFEGFVATQPIPAGTVVLGGMMIPRETQPVGNQLEVTVQFDTTLATSEVFDGDLVLLVDPGAEPTAEDPGRPQQALRPLSLRNYENGSMTMFLEPEEWAQWKALPASLGGLPKILPVPTGGTAEEFAQRINAVWLSEWEQKAQAATALTAPTGPQPGPGELEVVVSFDTSLAASGVSDGDTVLMIDPGKAPDREDVGRPREVLRTIELKNFDGGNMRLFAAPKEWLEWQTLPDDLGGAPMVLPIPVGTDIEDMTRRLNEEWEAEWHIAINSLAS